VGFVVDEVALEPGVSSTFFGFPLPFVIASWLRSHLSPTSEMRVTLTKQHIITTSVFILGDHLWPDSGLVVE
jgi:hypothetical protein